MVRALAVQKRDGAVLHLQMRSTIAAHLVQVIVSPCRKRQRLGDAVAEIRRLLPVSRCRLAARVCHPHRNTSRPAAASTTGCEEHVCLPTRSGARRRVPMLQDCFAVCSCSVLAGSSTGNAAKDGEVGHSVAAQYGFAPCTPPVTSPAANRPGITAPVSRSAPRCWR